MIPSQQGMDSSDVTLVIFAKRPRPGQGKQRLAAEIGKMSAFRVAEALLECAIEDAITWPGPVVIAPSDAKDAGWARELATKLGDSAEVLPQIDAGLGERLQKMDIDLRARGHEKLLFMGTDAPGLTPDQFRRAADALEYHDIVLADAEDGGVTLMGNRKPWPPLAELSWSAETLGVELFNACKAAGLSVARSDGGYDVDTKAELDRAADDLVDDNRTARRALYELIERAAAGLICSLVSVVIPCLSDMERLPRLLEGLRAQTWEPFEIIVVDGACCDGTKDIASRFGASLLQCKPGRGVQLDAGARAAKGEVIWFLHADSSIVKGAIEAVLTHVETGAIGGWFRFAFQGQQTRGRRFLAGATNFRCWLGVPYGDQGLFMTADAYRQAGGSRMIHCLKRSLWSRSCAKSAGFQASPSRSLLIRGAGSGMGG